MTWTIVVDVEAVRNRMVVPDHSDVNKAIDSALDAAHPIFQGILETVFEPNDGLIDFFFLNETRYPVNPTGFFRCRLRQGFVRTVTSVEVSTSKLDFSGATLLVFGTDYVYDLQRGIIEIDEKYRYQYIKITYDAGFEDGDDAPAWLRESVLTYVPIICNNQQPTNRSNEAEPLAKQAAQLATSMLEPYLRGRAFMFRPYHTL